MRTAPCAVDELDALGAAMWTEMPEVRVLASVTFVSLGTLEAFAMCRRGRWGSACEVSGLEKRRRP